MSYNVFFSFSSGLARSLVVPKGTLQAILDHVERVERELKIEVEVYRGETRWKHLSKPCGEGVSDKTLCKVAESHNRWVRHLFGLFAQWSKARREKKAPEGVWERQPWRDNEWSLVTFGHKEFPAPERLTPKQARSFWRALHEIDVPSHRWTMEHYRNRMEHAYEVLRGRKSEGVTLNARKPLTPKQAAAVVTLFAEWLDVGDLRLDVPNGYDYLASSYDGGYDWCEKCGPTHPDDGPRCRRAACPIRAEIDADDPERARRWVVKDKAAGTYLGRTPGEWPTRLDKRVLHFEDRGAAVAKAKLFPKRTLVVVPVRRDR